VSERGGGKARHRFSLQPLCRSWEEVTQDEEILVDLVTKKGVVKRAASKGGNEKTPRPRHAGGGQEPFFFQKGKRADGWNRSRRNPRGYNLNKEKKALWARRLLQKKGYLLTRNTGGPAGINEKRGEKGKLWFRPLEKKSPLAAYRRNFLQAATSPGKEKEVPENKKGGRNVSTNEERK